MSHPTNLLKIICMTILSGPKSVQSAVIICHTYIKSRRRAVGVQNSVRNRARITCCHSKSRSCSRNRSEHDDRQKDCSERIYRPSSPKRIHMEIDFNKTRRPPGPASPAPSLALKIESSLLLSESESLRLRDRIEWSLCNVIVILLGPGF
jgi:hypothetical protein